MCFATISGTYTVNGKIVMLSDTAITAAAQDLSGVLVSGGVSNGTYIVKIISLDE
jgi:hypothetical protein